MMVFMLLRDLSWVIAVADHGQVTDAAASLGTTQPTLSRAVARVEVELGVRIFARTTQGVLPTPTGEMVLSAAREVTTRYDRLGADLRQVLDPEAGVVRLAFLDSLATSLVPRVLRAFHQEAPRVSVLLSQEPAHEILADLDAGAVDVAITSPRPHGAYGWWPLHEERLVLAVPRDHRWGERRRVRVADLAGEELVTTPVGFGFRALVDELLREAEVMPVVSFESQDLATIEGLVAAGLGVAILPEQFAGQSGTVGIPLTTPAARRTVGLTWRTDRPLSAPAERFRTEVSGRPEIVE